MGLFDNIIHDIGRIAGATFHAPVMLGNVESVVLHHTKHPRKAVHEGVLLSAQAHAGDPMAKRKVQSLAIRSPQLRDMFAAISVALKGHPHYTEFRRQGPGATHPQHLAPPLPPRGHGFTSRPLPPGAHRHVVHSPQTPHTSGFAHQEELVDIGRAEARMRAGYAAEVERQQTGGAYREERVDVGARHPAHEVRTGAGYREELVDVGARHGHRPHGHRRDQGGPFGWGAEYILDERAELGDLPADTDQEPEYEYPPFHTRRT